MSDPKKLEEDYYNLVTVIHPTNAFIAPHNRQMIENIHHTMLQNCSLEDQVNKR